MLNLEEYQLIDEDMQVQLLKLDGVYLVHRNTSRLRVELFALYSFYVEVFYDKQNEDPLYYKSFEFGRRINIYLEGISIDKLFENSR